MSKKKQKSFQASSAKNSALAGNNVAAQSQVSVPKDQLAQPSQSVQPQKFSLDAYKHIRKYMEENKKEKLDKNDLNAVLRLSQHLRVFGLLSAVGYINQSNAQDNNETRKRTVPVWQSLLGQLIDENEPPKGKKLMEIVAEMARDRPSIYMVTWRKSLVLTNYWNFWGRAYQED